MGVLLRCAGWNLKRTVAALRMRARKAGTDLPAALKTALNLAANRPLPRCGGHYGLGLGVYSQIDALLRRLMPSTAFKMPAAA